MQKPIFVLSTFSSEETIRLAKSKARLATATITPVTSNLYTKTKNSKSNIRIGSFLTPPGFFPASSCPSPTGHMRKRVKEPLSIHKFGKCLQEESHFPADVRIMLWNGSSTLCTYLSRRKRNGEVMLRRRGDNRAAACFFANTEQWMFSEMALSSA